MANPSNNSTYDISVIITAHHEGVMAGISLRSLLDAREQAQARGITVQCIVVLDRPNAATQAVFSDCVANGWKVIVTDFGDQGRARMEGIEACSGEHVAFLDADDLWGHNWLHEALQVCREQPGRVIAHPEFNWFFHGNNNLFLKIDQTDPAFRSSFLRFGNYWDALCLAPRRAYVDHPFAKRDIDSGFAFEDWQWNLLTVEAGYVHRVVPDTIHFKRRRQGSQTLEASGRKALIRPTRLTDYSSYKAAPFAQG